MQDVQNLGKQMQDGFAAERHRRQEDNRNREKTMTAKMEEGFRSEQQARQLTHSEILKGLKNEENARQMVRKDHEVLKEEMKNLKMGSGSTVFSEASTGVGLGSSGTFGRALDSEIFISRKMEFEGCVTDYKKCSFQGLTANEVTNVIRKIQKVVPNVFHKYIDWDQTRTEQGIWPTKTFVNMSFKNETNMATMNGMLEMVKKMISRRYPTHCMARWSRKIGNEAQEEAFGKGACVVFQRSQRSGRI